MQSSNLTSAASPAISEPKLDAIREVYEQGLYLDAWRMMEPHGPPEQWNDPASLIMAGRVMGNLEGERRARALHSRAWRRDRTNAEAASYRAFAIQARLGPLRALRFLEKLPDFPDAAADHRASLLAQRAALVATFRDFTTAERLLDEAEKLDPENPWIWVERSFCLERADRYADALAAAQRALGLRPFYRPAVQRAAHLLGLLARDDEALALLGDASHRLQSPDVLIQHANLLGDHHRHAEALDALRRYRELAVLIEQPMIEAWHARMSNEHYELGDIAAAAEHAKLAKNGFHEKIASRLASPPAEARVVKLDVPFVRQHEMTCAPATLSALSHYWRAPVDHIALAREICYDGTQSHKEYDWAERNGYIVHFFTLTWDSARALLDRGVPFTLATVETTSAHLQAVIGYDSVRGTIFLRDPFLKHHSECICPGWLEDYAFCGPRAMVFLPAAEAHRLDGIELPDAALWRHSYVVDRALFVHARPRAAEALEALESEAPGHRITLDARRELAFYDGDQQGRLDTTNALLALHPASNNLLWARYCALRDLALATERRELLTTMAQGKKAEPLFWRELGEELKGDARNLPIARRWVMRALRAQPCAAENLHVMAGFLWDERRFEDAFALYRLAAHVRDRVPYLQRSWFVAARYFHKGDEVLAVFRRRFEEDGALSAQPAYILHNALDSLDRDEEALAVLDRALELRPGDGDLLLFTADVYARHARPKDAAELLARAEGKCSRSEWLRASAKIADYANNLAESHRLWREVLADSPLAFDAISKIARLTAEIEGRPKALEFMSDYVARFPHHIPLRELRAEWLREEGPAAQESALRDLLAIAPTNLWALREAAWVFSTLGRHAEALTMSDAAVAAAPHEASNHYNRGRVLLEAGRTEEALASMREAVRLSVDNAGAINSLVAACQTFDAKRAALDFVFSELQRQVTFGDGLFSYVGAAFRILDPEELLRQLRIAHEARPDLWQAWSVLITHLCDSRRAADALPLAREATERFPLIPGAWLDLARVHRERRDFSAEADACRRACEINRSWGKASRSLADALERCERYDEAAQVLELAVKGAPLDAVNRASLAHILWRQGRNPRAFTLLEETLRLDPSYGWAWDALRDWADSPARATELARELTRTRGGEPESWLRLAQMLPDDAPVERLAALDHAIALAPRNENAHDFRAFLLSTAGRYDEAIAACSPAVFGDTVPRSLRARAAWVLAERRNLPGAIAAMREVVAEHPDFYWAWERIAEWSDRLDDQHTTRDAAERMSRLDPQSAIPLGYLADAEMKLGNRAAALKVLERAFAIDPTYGFAGFTLFDAHLADGALDDAEAVLRRLETHLPCPGTAVARLRWLARKRDKQGAFSVFETLVSLPERESRAVTVACDALRKAGWNGELERAIQSRIGQPGTIPVLGDEWVNCFTTSGHWSKRTELERLDPALPLSGAAWGRFITYCGEKKNHRFLRQLIKKQRPALLADDELWGSVGYALSNCNRSREAHAWLSDWRQRHALKPWMLTNVVAAAQELNLDADALAASRHALTLRSDHTYPRHMLWLAVEEAASGDFAAARERLNQFHPDNLDSYDRTLWSLASAGCAVAEAAPAMKKSVYDSQATQLGTPEFATLDSDKHLRRKSNALFKRMAADCGLSFPGIRARFFRRRKVSYFLGINTDTWIVILAIGCTLLSRCSR